MSNRYGKLDGSTLYRPYTFGQSQNVIDLGIGGKVNNVSMPHEPKQDIVNMLAAAGWLPIVSTVYEPSTHKLAPGSWSVVGGEIKQNIIALTAEEATTRLNSLKDLAWEAIKGERIRRTGTGGYHVASVDKWFHSDTDSKTQQLGLVLMGAGLPDGIMWKTMNGSFVEMTQALAGEIFTAAVTQETITFGVAENHREQMLLSEDPLAYDYSAGWPLIYEDTL